MPRMHVVLLASVAMAACLISMPPSAAAMTHIVGGRCGWTVPPNQTFYQEWAKPRTFGVGDKLLFPYREALHSVIEVSKKDFESCTQKKVVERFREAPLTIELKKTGEHFYYSNIGIQCEAGLKLAIKVVDGKGSSGSEMPFHLENEPAAIRHNMVKTEMKASLELNSSHATLNSSLGSVNLGNSTHAPSGIHIKLNSSPSSFDTIGAIQIAGFVAVMLALFV